MIKGILKDMFINFHSETDKEIVQADHFVDEMVLGDFMLVR